MGKPHRWNTVLDSANRTAAATAAAFGRRLPTQGSHQPTRQVSPPQTQNRNSSSELDPSTMTKKNGGRDVPREVRTSTKQKRQQNDEEDDADDSDNTVLEVEADELGDNGMVSVKQTVIDNYKKKITSLTNDKKAMKTELAATKKDLTDATKALAKSTKELAAMTKAVEQSNGDKELLRNTIKKKDETVAELQKKLGDMTALLRKNGKVHASELNQELKTKVVNTARVTLFRTWKFVEDVEDLKAATRQLVQILPNKEADITPETVETFVDKYHLQVNEGLKLGRQYAQSDGKAAVEGTCLIL